MFKNSLKKSTLLNKFFSFRKLPYICQRFRITGNWRQTRERKAKWYGRLFCKAVRGLSLQVSFTAHFFEKRVFSVNHNADSSKNNAAQGCRR